MTKKTHCVIALASDRTWFPDLGAAINHAKDIIRKQYKGQTIELVVVRAVAEVSAGKPLIDVVLIDGGET